MSLNSQVKLEGTKSGQAPCSRFCDFIGGAELPTLDQAISAYQDTLEGLPQQGDANASPGIMKLLIARDDVARAVEASQPVSASAITRISALDQRLKDAAVKIDAVAGRKTLGNWRQTIHPLNAPWWWSLDERAAAAEQPSALWTIPAAVFFTLSISVIAETITTLRNGGLNALSAFGTLMQTLLALLAGSAFLSGGREWLASLFSEIGIKRQFTGKARVLLAVAVLVVTFAIRGYLPDAVARYRNYQGNQSLASKQYFSAVQEYQQAIALKPDLIDAQYHLGIAYDKSHDYSKAISQYEFYITFKPKNDTVYNKLARLYILHSKEYELALTNLNYLRRRVEYLPVEDRYNLHKNTGWAYLEQHNYAQAGGEFEAALQQRDGAAAHYLWGRVLDEQNSNGTAERQSNREKAKQQWDLFLKTIQHNFDQDEIEQSWGVYAQEQLQRGVENEKKTNP